MGFHRLHMKIKIAITNILYNANDIVIQNFTDHPGILTLSLDAKQKLLNGWKSNKVDGIKIFNVSYVIGQTYSETKLEVENNFIDEINNVKLIPESVINFTPYQKNNTAFFFNFENLPSSKRIKIDGKDTIYFYVMLQRFCETNKIQNLVQTIPSPELLYDNALVFFSEFHKHAIHNDIKPDNIIYCNPIFNFIDFGTAKGILLLDEITFGGTKIMLSPYKIHLIDKLDRKKFKVVAENDEQFIRRFRQKMELTLLSQRMYITKNPLRPIDEKQKKYIDNILNIGLESYIQNYNVNDMIFCFRKSDEYAFYISLLYYTCSHFGIEETNKLADKYIKLMKWDKLVWYDQQNGGKKNRPSILKYTPTSRTVYKDINGFNRKRKVWMNKNGKEYVRVKVKGTYVFKNI